MIQNSFALSFDVYPAKEDDAFAARHGCQPPKRWKSEWPLGFDLLYKAFHYARQGCVLQFFLNVVDESGTTFEQSLLGARGIDTIDPENIETVLSKNFQGMWGLVPLPKDQLTDTL
jgi:hypothetical protein